MNSSERKEIGTLIRHMGWKGAVFALVLMAVSYTHLTLPTSDLV